MQDLATPECPVIGHLHYTSLSFNMDIDFVRHFYSTEVHSENNSITRYTTASTIRKKTTSGVEMSAETLAVMFCVETEHDLKRPSNQETST